MRTLGIDLATEPKETAACWITWRDGTGLVDELIKRSLTDDVVVELCTEADRVAIDSPFGWPDAFVEAIVGWQNDCDWPGPQREPLRLRETDREVHRGGQNPLSVSSDKIGATAMRCAHILHQFSRLARGTQVDRVNGHIIEAYPAAALRAWQFDCTRYKGKKRENVLRRHALVAQLASVNWIQLPDSVRLDCELSDHCLDALVCALVARAVAVGLTAHPAPAQAGAATREGWIHVPNPSSLKSLAVD